MDIFSINKMVCFGIADLNKYASDTEYDYKNVVGTKIITELCEKLKQSGYSYVKLGWVKGNPQAEHFWKKNGFIETDAENKTEDYTVTVAQRKL